MYVRKAAICSVVLTAFLFAVSAAMAATNSLDSSQIGLVDINKIFDSHPHTRQLAQLEDELMSEMQKRQQMLNEKGRGKTREEVLALEQEMNLEWEPIRDRMLQERQNLIDTRYLDVIDAIRTISERRNLVLVIRSELRVPVAEREMLEMPLVLYGGIDITDEVIQRVQNSSAG